MVSTTRVMSLMAATAVAGRGLSSECAADAVNLRTAGDFAIIGKSGISNVARTVITGDIGVSPIAATAITGLDLILDSTNTFSTSSQTTGQVFAADYAEPTPTKMIAAVGDMETAYADAESRASENSPNVGGGDLSGLTLQAGVYKFTVNINIAGAKSLTLAGDECSVFIFQTSENFAVGSAAQVVLTGGVKAENVFWQVAGATSIGSTADVKGVVLCKTAADLLTESSLNGRVLAQTGVTLDAVTVDSRTAA